ncbi:MAG: haloalkane dehalogenase [Allosphingosinicella sp.]|uniref:haloalkane dehalogenase n=1 Tax=Allosphingosinicella sp. TaxID=2823234 RepID=UPI003923BDE1
MSRVLRTPDARFEGLKDFPYAAHHLEVGEGLRLAYVDEGPRDAPVVLLMHGEPTWSYLYRHIIAALQDRFRVVAPDLIGFGRSDKLPEEAYYSYERHVAWMREWLERLDLRDVTLFCQDWGGLIGLRLVAALPERFARVIAANTGLPTGTGMSEGFRAWLEFSQSVPVFPVGMIVNGGAARELESAEIAAYDAPFPDESYKAAARVFPRLVPVTPEHASVAENGAAWCALERFDKPFLTAFSDRDPVTNGGERIFQARVPGTRGQPHVTLPGGHFLQEDCPDEIARLIADFAG